MKGSELFNSDYTRITLTISGADESFTQLTKKRYGADFGRLEVRFISCWL